MAVNEVESDTDDRRAGRESLGALLLPRGFHVSSSSKVVLDCLRHERRCIKPPSFNELLQ